MTDLAIELDEPHKMMLEELVDMLGEEAIHSELHQQVIDGLRELYDARDMLEEQSASS
jgi:hypothetical protein